MAFLDNMKIGLKSMIPIVFMSILLGVLVLFAERGLQDVSNRAAEVIQNTDPAVVKSVRTTQLITGLSLEVYQAIVYDSASDDSKAVKAQFEKDLAQIETNFDDIAKLLPAHVDDVGALRAEYSTVRERLKAQFAESAKTSALTLGAQLTPDELTTIGKVMSSQGKIDEAARALIAKMVSFNDSVTSESSAEADALSGDSHFSILLILGLGIASVLIGLGVAITMTRQTIAKPIANLHEVMRDLAGGNNAVEVIGIGRGDEIGQMAKAVQVFKDAAIDKVRLENEAAANRSQSERDRLAGEQEKARQDAEKARIAQQQSEAVAALSDGLGRVAQGDLSVSIDTQFDGDLDALRHAFNDAIGKFADIVGQLRVTSSALKTATGEILSGANDLAERTTKQAAAIEETTAAIEQLSNTVNENAKRAENASAMSRGVSSTAEQTGEVMEKSNAAMERISASSSKISNIIGMIDDIAFQTNLLALNASVEAARAGDAGKGFAVVAVEVRRLAQSAAQASSEVKVLIEQSATEVMSGSKLVADATQKLVAMVDSVKDSANLIQEISSASQEQASAISQVSTAIRQMDEMTQHNAALVEETNAAIEQTENQANDLDRIVDQFVISGGTRQASRSDGPRPTSRPASAAPAKAPPKGIKALQDKVSKAAKSYLTRGNTAVKDEEWSEF